MQRSIHLWTSSGPHLLTVGRLAKEKGFDLLLEALHLVRERFPTADLVIAGSGPEEAALKAQSFDLGLESAVRFAGHVNDPATLFPCASVFVLSSRQEGMPNALLEAVAGGLPIVATPASGGITEMLRNQPGTWLATDTSAHALAASLLKALGALQSGQRFEHPFIEPFRIERAIHAYEELIDVALLDRKNQEPPQ
jgi:glycosyltransferase involved in cell wall biosynthesis